MENLTALFILYILYMLIIAQMRCLLSPPGYGDFAKQLSFFYATLCAVTTDLDLEHFSQIKAYNGEDNQIPVALSG